MKSISKHYTFKKLLIYYAQVAILLYNIRIKLNIND